jgi:hypothetical protein
MWFKAFLKAGYGIAFLDYLAVFYSHLILDYGVAHARFPGPADSPSIKRQRTNFPLVVFSVKLLTL